MISLRCCTACRCVDLADVQLNCCCDSIGRGIDHRSAHAIIYRFPHAIIWNLAQGLICLDALEGKPCWRCSLASPSPCGDCWEGQPDGMEFRDHARQLICTFKGLADASPCRGFFLGHQNVWGPQTLWSIHARQLYMGVLLGCRCLRLQKLSGRPARFLGARGLSAWMSRGGKGAKLRYATCRHMQTRAVWA